VCQRQIHVVAAQDQMIAYRDAMKLDLLALADASGWC
jgi:hypothetical protein